MSELYEAQSRIIHLVKRGRIGESVGILAMMAEAWPDQADIWYVLGIALEESGGFAAAIRAYRRSVSVDPTHQGAHEALAKLPERLLARADALSEADPEEAARLYLELQGINPGLGGRRLRHVTLRHFGEARVTAKGLSLWQLVHKAFAARRAQPEAAPSASATMVERGEAVSLCRRARELEEMFRREEAIELFRDALAADPDSQEAIDGLRRVRSILLESNSGVTILQGIGRVAFEWDGRRRRLSRLDPASSRRALLLFEPGAVLLDEGDGHFAHQSYHWEARALARLLLALGYDTDIVGAETMAEPGTRYDLAIGIHDAIGRSSAALVATPLKIALFTGRWPPLQNEAEETVLSNLERRRGRAMSRYRSFPDLSAVEPTCELADVVCVIGNDVTRATFPARFQPKIRRLFPTSSFPAPVKTPSTYVPAEREFLWFSGRGLALKGLDVLLDVFSSQTKWTLNVVGPVINEPDFEAVYERELYGHPQIRTHGFLWPGSAAMTRVVDRCFAFVAPSESDGMSTSALTCMTMGLFPIVSPQTGISLPDDAGIMVPTRSLDAWRSAIGKAYEIPESRLSRDIAITQRYARSHSSREHFLKQMNDCFAEWGIAGT